MNRSFRTPTTRGATGRGAHSGSQRLATGLGWFSIGLGLTELLAARTLSRTLGMEGREGLIRAYGTRELMTGVAILMSHDPTPWIWGRVGGDALDLATLGTGFQGGNRQAGNLTLATAAVAGVTLVDVLCAQNLTAEKRLSDGERFDYSDRTGFPRPPAQMRGKASDLDVPGDFRIPDPLRPWQDGKPAPGTSASAAASTP